MSSNRVVVVSEPLLRTGCLLGEGPLYDASTQTLHFVDIESKRVLHLDTTSLELTHEEFTEPITCLALRQDGRLACATASGIALLEGNSKLNYLCKPIPEPEQPYTRLNDGACDSKGRFYVGSLYNKERGIPGRLYCYNPDTGVCTVADDGPFTDSNGLGWSLDDKTMYFTDSFTNIIYAYDYDASRAMLSNRRVFVDAMAQGLPEGSFCDGLCIDSEGCLWSARWGGSRIIRFDTEGQVDFEIYFPTVYSVTACCFGGPNNDQLYVTTAHAGVLGGDPNLQFQYPDSGHLFVVDLAGRYQGGEWRHKFAL
ncbi:hypothetical protein FA95DRAFT_1580489 [Auriscalpium vulgare]|uniref:Uncharacterized protein n=1 Tax=Auriscalpium vulgare TaxID=40419 RepID=A0ACB8S6K5_9AGAM|nr:hypothetical protein FA95DRAFT_1580489 [Auriscalpium vulgare]